MEEESEAIAMNAIIKTISTPSDGGWRITFDIPESDTAQVMDASKLRGKALKLVVMKAEDLNE